MQPGTIVMINGASSSGKTSLVRALQNLSESPLLECGLDKFVFMLPERWLERPLWDGVLGLAVQAGPLGHQLMQAMHQAVRAAALSGLAVAADHVLVEPAWAAECAALFHNLPAYLVGVRCPLEELERRERQRKNRTLGQARAQFELVHAYASYDLEVDTAQNSPEECARQVVERVQGGLPPAAFKQMRARLRTG